MKVWIGNEEYEYLDHIVDNESIRTNFMELINDSFEFDFRPWYQEGYWTDKYEPHVLVKKNQVVATVTVNHMRYQYQQEERRYIQLGGVLTRNEYRHKNLGRWLLEHIIERYKNQVDQIFLLSNDSAVNYYPKFGFIKAQEYIAEYKWENKLNISQKEIIQSARKLDLRRMEDRIILLECYQQSNPFSRFPSVECQELLIFYGMGFLKDCLYYFPEIKMVAVAEYNSKGLLVDDIYGNISCTKQHNQVELFEHIVAGILAMAEKQDETFTVQLGFTPVNELSQLTILPLIEEDDTLYILADKENLFEADQLRFPILSHN